MINKEQHIGKIYPSKNYGSFIITDYDGCERVTMNKITIGLLPVTKEIVVGKVNQKTGMWVGARVDVTNDAIIAVGDYLVETEQKMKFTTNNGKEYVLSAEELCNDK